MLISVKAKATYELPAESFVLLMVEPHPHAPDHQLPIGEVEVHDLTRLVQRDGQGRLGEPATGA